MEGELGRGSHIRVGRNQSSFASEISLEKPFSWQFYQLWSSNLCLSSFDRGSILIGIRGCYCQKLQQFPNAAHKSFMTERLVVRECGAYKDITLWREIFLLFLFFYSFHFNMGPYIYIKNVATRLSFACHPHSHAAARAASWNLAYIHAHYFCRNIANYSSFC